MRSRPCGKMAVNPSESGASLHIDSGIDLTRPEFLTTSNILRLFKERCIQHDGLEELNRTELLEFYHQTLLPLPQREYRENRRGRILKRMQETLLTRKRKRDLSEEVEPTKQSINSTPIKLSRTAIPCNKSESSPKSLNTSSTSPRSTDSSSSNVSVDKTSSSGRSFNESGRKMIKLINDTLQSSDSSAHNFKKRTHSESGKDERNGKKDHSSSNSAKVTSDCRGSDSQESSTKKKKHTPITWP